MQIVNSSYWFWPSFPESISCILLSTVRWSTCFPPKDCLNRSDLVTHMSVQFMQAGSWFNTRWLWHFKKMIYAQLKSCPSEERQYYSGANKRSLHPPKNHKTHTKINIFKMVIRKLRQSLCMGTIRAEMFWIGRQSVSDRKTPVKEGKKTITKGKEVFWAKHHLGIWHLYITDFSCTEVKGVNGPPKSLHSWRERQPSCEMPQSLGDQSCTMGL